jgi:uncharacterized protein YodC (DUF2158 family)
MELSIGNVVELKSGSPKMTVKEVDLERVVCNWFTFDGILEEGDFYCAQLIDVSVITGENQDDTETNAKEYVRERKVGKPKRSTKNAR